MTVYVMVRPLSFHLSYRSPAAMVADRFTAEHQRLQQMLIDSCGCHGACTVTQQQIQPVSCREPMEEA